MIGIKAKKRGLKGHIYLDNAATTKVDDKVIRVMNRYMAEKYGNPSSLHKKGEEAKKAVDNARRIIAYSLNADSEEIFFTSGGTESINWAIKGVAFANKDKGNHIITTKIEHKCVLNSCKWLEGQGFKVTYLDVDKEGFINLEELEDAINSKTILVSIIHGNNEIGTIQDIKSIGSICRKKNVLFHIDACQSYTKTSIDVEKMNIDLATINSHKIHGPKGVGALYIKKGTNIIQWQHGGDQESQKRAGTENVPGIIGFAEAVRISDKKYIKQMSVLRDRLIRGVLKISGSQLNGPRGDKRLCNNTNFSFRRIEGEAIGLYLDILGVASSTGSACTSRRLEPSHVLKAIGLNHEQCNSSLRLTLSRYTTKEEIDYVVRVLPGIVEKLREISPLK